MTKIEQHLIDTTEYLKSIGLTTFLIGSTLLQIVRTGEYKNRHQFDREINVGCRYEQFTEDMEKKIRKDFNKVQPKGNYILFGNQEDDFWEKGYFSLLAKFKKHKNERVEYMGVGHYLRWDAKHLKKLQQINYKGYKFYVPNYRIEWLERYYGKTWRQEDLSWNWEKADNHIQISDTKELG